MSLGGDDIVLVVGDQVRGQGCLKWKLQMQATDFCTGYTALWLMSLKAARKDLGLEKHLIRHWLSSSVSSWLVSWQVRTAGSKQ